MIIKLNPALKNYLWGGEKLKTQYGKKSDGIIAESWELSFHKDGESTADGGASAASGAYNGKPLKEIYSKADYGSDNQELPFFPVLIKFIDAKDSLSVQVHPGDGYALKNENQFGKTEMWYILGAEKGCGIYCGFKRNITKGEFRERINNNTLTEVLNFIPVKRGEFYLINAGTVHAIGGGVTILEIQQNSNLTYRIYDYNRKDANGNPRELHIEKAAAVASLTPYGEANKPVKISESVSLLVKNKYFTVYLYNVSDKVAIEKTTKTYQCITVIDGSCSFLEFKAQKGDSFFIPAGSESFEIKGKCNFILTCT